MSLCIFAHEPIPEGLEDPEEKWNWPQEDDFAYRDNHSKYEADCEFMESLVEKYRSLTDKTVIEFSIGYGGFKFMREKLALLLGFEYYQKDPSNPFDWWLRSDREDEDAESLFDFFLHPDSDGDFDSEHIKVLARNMKPLTDEQLKTHDKLEEFNQFVQRSSEQGLEWNFG